MVGETSAENVKLLQKLAQEARSAADQMNDPFCRRVMLEIAAGYERLAQHAQAQPRDLKVAS
jgi:hypothetical protein